MKDKAFLENEKALNIREEAMVHKTIRVYKSSMDKVMRQMSDINKKGELTPEDVRKKGHDLKLLASLENSVDELTDRVKYTTSENLKAGYLDSRLRGRYSAEKTIGAELAFDFIDEKVVRQSLKNPLDKIGFINRIDGNQKEMKDKLRTVLTEGLITGDGFEVIGKRVKDEFDIGLNDSVRIARNELHRVNQDAKLESMRETARLGIKQKKMWMATLDKRTRTSHRKLDGQTADIEGSFEFMGKNAIMPSKFGIAGFDINCRCTIITIFEDVDYTNPNVRVQRNEKGKSVLRKWKNYDEWYKERAGAFGAVASVVNNPAPAPVRADNFDKSKYNKDYYNNRAEKFDIPDDIDLDNYSPDDITNLYGDVSLESYLSESDKLDIQNALVEMKLMYPAIDTKNIAIMSESGTTGNVDFIAIARAMPINEKGLFSLKRTIGYSEKYYNPKLARESLNQMAKNVGVNRGMKNAYSPKGIMLHEAGHQLDYEYWFQNREMGIAFRSNYKDGMRILGNEYSNFKMQKDYSFSGNVFKKMMDKMGIGNDIEMWRTIKANLGEYAMTNDREFLAELMGVLHDGKDLPVDSLFYNSGRDAIEEMYQELEKLKLANMKRGVK